VVLEEDKSADVPVPPGFVELDRRTYATTQVIIMTLGE
ncbi:MAG: 16S rRNA (guanine(966)-N(2))-methyltransferase RsmD, partial [Rhodobiaceae bacterium]|nr:16S rRNA (guanine(966)-N(2))-methyltransferase RsmD [Rhodobiaceae bacterium]